MAHLFINENDWYLGSPFELTVTVENALATDLTNLTWRIDEVLEITDIAAVDDPNGNVIVSVIVNGADTATLAEGIYDWQLQGDVQGTGPEVLAIGKIRFWPLAMAPPTP